MKRLITLIRHADADWPQSGQSDFDRPLSQLGESDAQFMGKILKDRQTNFDLMLTSTAKRALNSTKILCNTIDDSFANVEQKPELYLASPSKIMTTIQSVDNQHQNIAIICHNPGLTDFSNIIGNQHILNLPTCGMMIIEVELESWSKLHPNCGQTLDFLYPDRFK